MARAYNVVDADGHILEPLDLWDNYIGTTMQSSAHHARPFPQRSRPC